MMEKSEMKKRMKDNKGDIMRDKDWVGEKGKKDEVEKVIRKSMTLK